MQGRMGIVAAFAWVLAGAVGPAAAAGTFQGTVATVGGESISAQEVRTERDRPDLKHSNMGLAPLEANLNALEMAVRRRLVLLEVKKRKLQDGPLGDRIKAVTIPAYAALYRKARLKEVAVTDAEIDRTAPAAAMERRRVSYIVTTSAEQARKALSRAEAGENFAALAAEYSEGPGSEKGGDIGWLEKGQNKYFPDEQWEAIFRLPKGGVTQIFPSPLFEQSLSIVRVDEIERYSPHEVTEMRNAVRNQLREKKVDAEIAGLVNAARLSLNEPALATVSRADRGAVLAGFDGGAVTAGVFRAYLERGQQNVAGLDIATLRQHLEVFGKAAVVAAKKERDLLKIKGYAAGIKKATDEAIVKNYFELLYAGVTATDAETESYYREHPEANRRPAQVELLQIRTATKEEADEAYARLKKGEDFESVAVLFAQTAVERQKAGRVGLVREGELPDPLGSTVFSLNLMEISQPYAERFGYFIFQVLRKIPAKELSLQERKAEIGAELLQRKKEQAFSDTLARLKSEYKIKVDNAAIEKM